jgi:4-amino-4-deoxy-L-arabinose transferase-like glycosyltransferase
MARWGLPLLLAGQAILGLTLIGRPAVIDEMTYIVAGRAEIAHWLHGQPVQPYAHAFSGAPVIYPVLAAAAASVGGLVAARLLSLVFIMTATALLWSAARKLFGPGAALAAGLLFATTAAALYISTLATFDAMSLMLLAAAARCALAIGDSGDKRPRAGPIAGVVLLLAAANATKYPSALWDPVVVAIAALAGPRWNARTRATVAVVTAADTAAVLVAAVLIGGSSYWRGITFSTVDRTVNGGHSAASILGSATAWVGIVTALAIVGAIALGRSRASTSDKALGWVMVAAVFLAPVNQARIGVMVSLFKHVGFGAWFAAIPAGYGISAAAAGLSARRQRRDPGPARSWARPAVAAVLALLVAGVVTGIYQAWQRYNIPPPYSAAAIAQIQPLQRQANGLALADTPSELIYYTRTSPELWVNTYSFSYTDPATRKTTHGAAAYAAAIHRHIFGIIILTAAFAHHHLDEVIRGILRHDHGYHLAVVIPHGSAGKAVLIWR